MSSSFKPNTALRSGLMISQLVAIIQRRWRLSALGMLVVLTAVAGFTLSQKSTYSSTSLVMIDPRSEKPIASMKVLDAAPVNSEMVDSALEILGSSDLLAALGAKLQASPFALPQKSLAAGEAGDARLLASVKSRLSVQRRRLSYVLEVTARDENPQRAAFLANTLVSLFVSSQSDIQRDATANAYSWLSERAAQLQAELRQKEDAVEAYRTRYGLLSSDGKTLSEQQMTALETAVLQARGDVAEKQARRDQVKNLMAHGGLPESIAAVVRSTTISELRKQETEATRKLADLTSRYADQHPSITQARAEIDGIHKQIASELRRLVQSESQEADIAMARLNTMQEQAARARETIEGDNKRTVALRQLERDATATRSVYQDFLQRSNEVAGMTTLTSASARIVSTARPAQRPSSPNKALSAVVGVALGLLAAAVIAAIGEMLDDSLNGDADEVAAQLGTRVLTVLPRVRRPLLQQVAPLARPEDFLAASPLSFYSEAMRSLRQATDHAFDEEETQPMTRRLGVEGDRPLAALRPLSGGRVLAICSALPQEGKTSTATSLARTVALSGRRVLLIDCDTRLPSLHRMLAKQPVASLLDVLVDGADWRTALAQDKSSTAMVMTAGNASLMGNDIFESEAMARLLNDARREFHLIILDCPPLLGAAEACSLARIADACVLTARWRRTPRRAALAAMDLLHRSGANLLGVVLNLYRRERGKLYGANDLRYVPVSPAWPEAARGRSAHGSASEPRNKTSADTTTTAA